MATEAQKKASAKWEAKSITQVKMKLHNKWDKDILDKLDSVGNKQGYIKQLIRDDIAKGGGVK